MMPYEHYIKAEKLLEAIHVYENDRNMSIHRLNLWAQQAQVHAMLANVGTKISSGDDSI